jgi:hypothetical protein
MKIVRIKRPYQGRTMRARSHCTLQEQHEVIYLAKGMPEPLRMALDWLHRQRPETRREQRN